MVYLYVQNGTKLTYSAEKLLLVNRKQYYINRGVSVLCLGLFETSYTFNNTVNTQYFCSTNNNVTSDNTCRDGYQSQCSSPPSLTFHYSSSPHIYIVHYIRSFPLIVQSFLLSVIYIASSRYVIICFPLPLSYHHIQTEYSSPSLISI